MALFHGVINSKALMKDTTLSMIVPSDDRKNIGFQGQPQLLILLHGAGGSNYTWSKYSSIERYTEPLNLIVLMPNIEFSFGLNMSNGLNYQSYLGEELPQWAEKTFGLKLDRETTTIAGQSMGGFAAIHTVLAYPNKFGKCGVFSAPLALDEYLTGERPLGANMAHSKLVSMWKDSIFGKDEADLTEASIRTKLQAFDAQQWPLKLFHACGAEDMLYQDSKKKHYNLKKTSRFLAVGFWIIAISCVPVLISLWFDTPWICIICVILLVLGTSVLHDYESGGKLK